MKRISSKLLHYCFLLLFGSASLLLNAQATDSPDILKIRARYQEVNAAITACEASDGEPCGYYLNTISANERNEPWAAVGIYTSQQDFWYQRVESGEEPSYQLQKLNIFTKRSARKEVEEYLFDEEGNLCFYYFKLEGNGDAETSQAFRFYFENGKLIAYKELVGSEERDFAYYSKDDGNLVLENGKRILELFALMVEE